MKKITSIILSVLTIISVAIAMPITSNAYSIPDEAGFVNKFATLRSKYPNGGTWSGTYYEGGYARAWTCHGYAWQIAYGVFGSTQYTKNGGWTKSWSMGTLNAGDFVRINKDTHSIFITKVTSDRIYFTDGNWNYKNRIRWDASYTKTEMSQKFTYKFHISGNNLTGNGDIIPTGSKTVSDGEYHVVTALNNSLGLNVAYNSKDSGKNVQLWNNMDDANTTSLIKLKYLSNGNYTMTFKNSGKNLDVQNGSKNSGANVWQYWANTTKAQQWIVKPAGDGYFYIISALSGKYLDVSGGNAKAATNIQVYNGNNSKAQKWKFIASGASTGQTIKNGDYTIATTCNTNYGLNIFGGKTDNGANIHLWGNMKGNAQNAIANVKYLGNGLYTITFKRSNKCLDVAGGSTSSGANVQQWSYAGNRNQKWIIKSAGNGYYYIISNCSGLYLDVYGAKVANGTNIQAYLGNGSNAQKWKFTATPALAKSSVTINKGKTYQLTINRKVGAATFTSSNTKIATVTSSGVIIGKAKGKTTIKVYNNGVNMTCTVTVK